MGAVELGAYGNPKQHRVGGIFGLSYEEMVLRN